MGYGDMVVKKGGAESSRTAQTIYLENLRQTRDEVHYTDLTLSLLPVTQSIGVIDLNVEPP